MYLTNLGLVLLAITTSQHWSPPHYIMGYQWGEWASIATIIIFVSGAIVGLVKIAVVNPSNVTSRELKRSIDSLTIKVDGIGKSADEIHKEHDRRLDAHDLKIQKHEDEIQNLKEKIGK